MNCRNILILFLVSLSLVAGLEVIGLTGSISTGNSGVSTWSPPKVVSSSNCDNTTNTGNYLKISLKFDESNSSIYFILGAKDSRFSTFMEVLLYDNTFDPNFPCQGAITTFQDFSDTFSGDYIRQPYYFAPGEYNIIVTSENTMYTGQFIINLIPADAVVSVDDSSPLWLPPNFQCYHYSSDVAEPAARYPFSVEKSGYYDILALPSTGVETTLAVYGPGVNVTDLEYRGCNDQLIQFKDHKFAYINHVYLEAGTSYTALASNAASVGFQVVPTRLRWITYSPTFKGVEYFAGVRGNCKEGGGSDIWATVTFVAQHSYVGFFNTPPSYSYPSRDISGFTFDTTTAVYYGDNSGVFNTTAPAVCPTGASKFAAYNPLGGSIYTNGVIGGTYTYLMYPNVMEDKEPNSAVLAWTMSGRNVNGLPDVNEVPGVTIASATTTAGENDQSSSGVSLFIGMHGVLAFVLMALALY